VGIFFGFVNKKGRSINIERPFLFGSAIAYTKWSSVSKHHFVSESNSGI